MTPTTSPGRPLPLRSPTDDHRVARYLRRLGLTAEAPGAEALVRLHRAHVERIPYETFWIHLTEGWGIEPDESLDRLVASDRGGYCFQLNGAFAALLERLGYRVTRHVAGVHGPEGPDPTQLTNHVALLVHDLPTDANPGGRWYVDAGLGDALHEPLPLIAGEYVSGPFRFTLRETTDGGWHFLHDPAAGSLTGVSITSDPVGMDAFTDRHHFNSTSPESSFARTVTAHRRHATGADVMRGCVLTRRDGGTTTTKTFEERDEWLAALDEVFGLRLAASEPALASLWTRVRTAHAEWLATEGRS